jgi:hypothetical protein
MDLKCEPSLKKNEPKDFPDTFVLRGPVKYGAYIGSG